MGIYRNIFWILASIIYLFLNKGVNSVIFLDVGQGDATLIQQGNMQILIDGGPDISVLYGLGKYMPFLDREIEYVYLTHPHDDHMVGILHILKNYKVGRVIYSNTCNKNPNYKSLLQSDIKLIEIDEARTISSGDLQLNSIWPNNTDREVGGCRKPWDGNINNDSVVLDLKYLGQKFLLMGDAEQEVEQILISEGKIDKEYYLLKAGHHCSKTATGETFLKRVSPTSAVCSVGEGNRFGHPSSETLKSFDSLGVQYFLTSVTGDIQIKE